MTAGECEYGENGCVPVQNLKTEVGEMKVQLKSNTDAVCEIKKLLYRAVLLMGVLTTVVQVVFKFWK